MTRISASRFDRNAFIWTAAVIMSVFLVRTWPSVPVHTTVIKLYVFHLLGWPLAGLILLKKGIRWSVDEICILLYTGLYLITSFFSSFPEQTAGRLMNVLLCTAWYIALREFTRERPELVRKFLYVYFMAASLLSLVGLSYQFAVAPVFHLHIPQRLVIPVCSTNTFASLLIPAVLTGAAMLVQNAVQRKFRICAAVSAGLLLQITAFVFTRSQASSVGLITGAAVLGWSVLYVRSDRNAKRKLAAAGVIALIAGALSAAWLYPRLGGTFEVRKLCWPAGLKAMAAHPLGSGPGTGPSRIPDFIDPVWRITPYFGAYIYHFHNEFIETGVETGVAGIVLFLLFLLLIIKSGFSKTAADPLKAAAAAGFLGICVEMNASVNMRLWTLPVVFWFFAALLPCLKGKLDPSPRQKSAAALGVFLLIIPACILIAESWRAENELETFLSEGSTDTGKLHEASCNRLVPRDALTALNMLSEIYNRESLSGKRSFHDVREILDRIHRYVPDYCNSRLLLLGILYNEKNYNAALESAGDAFRYNPFKKILWNVSAVSAAEVYGLSSADSAKTILEKADHLSEDFGIPEDLEVFLTGMILYRKGYYREAVSIFSGGMKNNTLIGRIGAVPAAEIIGLKSPDPVDGLKIIEQYLQQYPNHPEARRVKISILLRNASMLEHQGKVKEARFCLENALELDPDNKAVLQKIKDLKGTGK